MTIKVGNKKYTSKQISNLQPLPALLQTWGPTDNIEQVLSLEMIKNLQMQNTKHIDIIKRNKAIETTINVTVLFLIIMALTILMF